MPLYLAYIQTIALSIIAGGSIVLGTFLIRGFKQQLQNKQSEIDTLKTHIEHLESLTAPALADQLKKLTPLIQEYAEKVQVQEKQLQSMSPANVAFTQESYRLGVTRTVLEAIGAVVVIFQGLDATSPILEKIKELTASLLTTLAEATSGKTPDLPHVETTLAIIAEVYPEIANSLRSLAPPGDNLGLRRVAHPSAPPNETR